MTAQTIGKQLLRSATSVGSNDRAAVRGRSGAECVAKMGIFEEECDESIHWMDVLVERGVLSPKRVAELRKEANEIMAITISSMKTARRNSNK